MFKKIKLFTDHLPRRPRRHIAKRDRIETIVLEETVTYRPRLQVAVDKGVDLEAVDHVLHEMLEASREAGERFPAFIDRLRVALPEGARIHLHDPEDYEEAGPVKVRLDLWLDEGGA